MLYFEYMFEVYFFFYSYKAFDSCLDAACDVGLRKKWKKHMCKFSPLYAYNLEPFTTCSRRDFTAALRPRPVLKTFVSVRFPDWVLKEGIRRALGMAQNASKEPRLCECTVLINTRTISGPPSTAHCSIWRILRSKFNLDFFHINQLKWPI